ncbi:hypothetical protein CARG_04045 [Corynebacterium argentoratense DSM 44202]|uniref:Transmembrane protein n=1 Tax=Corynebacterium argentoratense DSM 44202 TaxID=1348662 RepID=U3GXW0_9CORY|nr:hypothetical protein CARG_04045 [Corynebacterium argentoratense DSM 44202]
MDMPPATLPTMMVVAFALGVVVSRAVVWVWVFIAYSTLSHACGEGSCD